MLKIGHFHELEVLRDTASGLYLGIPQPEGEENPEMDVLLPGKFIPEGTQIGDKLRVFLYKDNENRLIATTQTPKAIVNQVAFLTVNQISQYGAFMEWGIEKDLFVPFKEQKGRMQEGESHLIYIYEDLRTERLVGSASLHRFLDNEELDVEEGDEVDIIVWDDTDLGVNVVINHQYKGLVYDNEIFTPLYTGDELKGYIKKIREDNKIDVRLQKVGHRTIEPNSQKILEKIKEGDGFLALNDRSNPEEIYAQLGMSKKNFKKAVGLLYKQRIIKLDNKGISLSE